MCSHVTSVSGRSGLQMTRVWVLCSRAWWRCSTALLPLSSRPTPHSVWLSTLLTAFQHPPCPSQRLPPAHAKTGSWTKAGAMRQTAPCAACLLTHIDCLLCRRPHHGIRRLPGSWVDRRRAGRRCGEGSAVLAPDVVLAGLESDLGAMKERIYNTARQHSMQHSWSSCQPERRL